MWMAGSRCPSSLFINRLIVCIVCTVYYIHIYMFYRHYTLTLHYVIRVLDHSTPENLLVFSFPSWLKLNCYVICILFHPPVSWILFYAIFLYFGTPDNTLFNIFKYLCSLSLHLLLVIIITCHFFFCFISSSAFSFI